MTISQRLYTALGAMTLAGAVLAGVSAWNLQVLSKELDQAINLDAVKLDLINSVRARTWEMVADMRSTFLWSNLKDQSKVDAAMVDWSAARKRTHEITAQLGPLLVSEEGKRMMQQIEGFLADYEKSATDYMQYSKNGEYAKVAAIAPRTGALVDELEKVGDEFRLLQLRLLKAADVRADETRVRSLWLNGSVTLLLFATSAFALFGVRGINKTLRKSILELSEGGEQVAAASSQIAATSQTLSQGASEQAASLEEVSASMEEITAMATRNTENSTQATSMMGETASQVDQSNSALQEMVASMSAIKSSSERVAKIIKTIDEIAFQTNILALNAAVEAARAGEAGMGFAVVADEVRNLAQRSAVAAKDTASLIEEAIANSNLGAEKLELVATAIRGITGSAARVRSLVDEVSESSKQQTLGINQTATAVTQVSQVTQSAAASAEESAAAAEELSAQSQNIRDLVHTLRVLVDGSGSSAGSPASRLHGPFSGRAQNAQRPQRAMHTTHLPANPVKVTSQHGPAAAVVAPPAPPSFHDEHDPFPMDTHSSGNGNFKAF
jgi:methyl-accepting chemotaxis protein